MMKYYPVNLDVRNRKCLVVGGGNIGTRKVETLLKCGAKVTVVCLSATGALHELADEGSIHLIKREYESGDLDGMFLVIGATDDEELNRKIHADAERLNKPCNIVDRPEVCSFIVPAIISRGDLVIAISTSGKSPAFAKKLRKDLEREFGKEYEVFLRLMGSIREKILRENIPPETRKAIFEKLAGSKLPELIRDGKKEDIDRLILEITGAGYEYDKLVE